MEVAVESPRSPTSDIFDFGGAMSSLYISAPASPKRFGEYNYLSAPASPTRLAQLYSEFEYFSSANSSTIPIDQTHSTDRDEVEDNNGFAFSVNDDLLNASSRSAEELFDGGKIKPLNYDESSFGGERRGRERERTTKAKTNVNANNAATTLASSKSGRRVTRSHSPYRESSSAQYTWQLEQQRGEAAQPQRIVASGSSSSKGSSRRWRFRDFLLFRSASEGRASSKDPLKKLVYKKGEEVNGSKRRGNVSAHEVHYAMKKAESEDLKKRTFLPYRQGILGRLRGFGF